MINKEHILNLVKSSIKSIDPEAKVFLFGSRARGESNRNSDWDFLILTKKEITQDLKNKISDVLFETELETDQVLTSLVQNENTWSNLSYTPFYKNVTKDSIRI